MTLSEIPPRTRPVRATSAPRLASPKVFMSSVQSVLPGVDVPGTSLTNARLAELMAEVRDVLLRETGREIEVTTPEFPMERVGIESRRVLDRELTARDLAREAGRRALEASGVDPQAIRLLMVASVTADRVVPSMAACVQRDLGLSQELMAFDLPQGCCGFVSAVEIAWRMLQTMGEDDAALVIGADAMTRVLDASDRTTCTIFGDGSGATVLSRSGGCAQILATGSWTEGGFGNRIEIRHEPMSSDPLFRFTSVDGLATVERDLHSRLRVCMEGPAVYRDMIAHIPERILRFLGPTGTTLDEVDHFVFHQANRRLLEGVARNRKAPLPLDRMPVNIGNLGNTTNASVPILLASLQADGRLEPGQTVLCGAFGAGYAIGFALLRWLG